MLRYEARDRAKQMVHLYYKRYRGGIKIAFLAKKAGLTKASLSLILKNHATKWGKKWPIPQKPHE
jgi:hypothetical protein